MLFFLVTGKLVNEWRIARNLKSSALLLWAQVLDMTILGCPLSRRHLHHLAVDRHRRQQKQHPWWRVDPTHSSELWMVKSIGRMAQLAWMAWMVSAWHEDQFADQGSWFWFFTSHIGWYYMNTQTNGLPSQIARKHIIWNYDQKGSIRSHETLQDHSHQCALATRCGDQV